MFHRKISKDELKNQVAQVTLEIQQLQCKAQDLRKVFAQLDNLYAEAESCCFFPCTYILLRDMVSDAKDLATDLQCKWYGSTDPQSRRNRARGGGVKRLMENCRNLASRLTEFTVIMNGLHNMSYKELEQTLAERQATLTEQRVIFNQLQDLLQQLQALHTESQTTWFLPRYMMLKRVTNSVFAAFKSVAGLSAPAAPTTSSTASLIVAGKDKEGS